jgi:GT2 family glycosyltransferase
MSERRVCAVTVAWNCREQVLALVGSVLAQDWPGLDVVVVDNASEDGTADAVAAAHPGVRVVRNRENRGGAGGFSDGIRSAWGDGHDAYWLLDGDALADGGALAPLVAALDEDPSAGAVCSQIAVLGNPSVVQEEGGGVDPVRGAAWTLRGGEAVERSRRPHPVGYGAACSLLIRREALAACGPFRDDLFVFYDDIEWGVRAARHGWKTVAVPASVVFHPPHASKPVQPWRIYYSLRNHLEFMRCHGHGMGAAWHRLRRCCETAMRASRLTRWRESSLAEAVRAALDDAAAGRLGRRDGLRGLESRPDGWRLSSPESWPPGPVVVVPPVHPGESASMLAGLSAVLRDRSVLVLTTAGHPSPSGWPSRPIPVGGRARRQAIRQALAAPGAVAVFGECEVPVPNPWLAVRWRLGAAWVPDDGAWPTSTGLEGAWMTAGALRSGTWAWLRMFFREVNTGQVRLP